MQDFGQASLEDGDVMPIGNGTVLIGMSERSQARMIEQIAKNLFADGAAERVIAALMTKDRAHMHLDTVFTFLDRDKVTAYPTVVNNIRAISLRPRRLIGDFHVTVEKDFLSAVADALKAEHRHQHPRAHGAAARPHHPYSAGSDPVRRAASGGHAGIRNKVGLPSASHRTGSV